MEDIRSWTSRAALARAAATSAGVNTAVVTLDSSGTEEGSTPVDGNPSPVAESSGDVNMSVEDVVEIDVQPEDVVDVDEQL